MSGSRGTNSYQGNEKHLISYIMMALPSQNFLLILSHFVDSSFMKLWILVVITGINERFDQPEHKMYENLIEAVKQEILQNQF